MQIFLDEFANTPQGENVLQLFSTARSRNISITAIVQSQGQLKGLFKDEAENIQGTSDCLIYMGSNEPSVHKEISEQLGKYSIHKQSSSDTVSGTGSNTVNTDSLGKDLMSPDRIRLMPSEKQLVLIRGFDPVIDDKYHTQDSGKFRLAKSLGRYEYSGLHVNERMGFTVPASITEDDSYYYYPFFSPDEIFSLPDDAFSIPEYDDIPDGQLITELLPSLIMERQENQ